jgi:hypothetical protein
VEELSSLSKEIARLRSDLNVALSTIREDNEMLLKTWEEVRNFINWQADWKNDLEKLPDRAVVQLDFIVKRLLKIIEGKVNASS